MELFLQIVGGFVLAILLVLASVYVYFRLKFGKYMDLDTDANQTPLHIHLNEDISPDWLNDSAAKKATSELEKMGFSAGKTYAIYEMDGYVLQAFYNSPMIAVLYKHDIAGFWVDVVTEEVDGMEYTVSNAPMGAEMSERPDSHKVFKAKAAIIELVEDMKVLVAQSDKSFLKVDSDNFREYFEAAFKKDISWKNRKGGISYEEFVVTAENETPFKSSKKVMEEAFVVTKEQELYQWHYAALEEYRAEENIKEDDIYEFEGHMLAVPFATNAVAFLRYLCQQGFITDAQQEKLLKVYSNETDITGLFDKLNSLLSPELRANFVKDIDYPLPIKLYKLSDAMRY